MQKQQFGMMDEGYFVPKSDILAWINDLLKIHISKIQALGSGSIYCQLFDVIHPGKLNLQKVNWKAKNDNQFLANFRLLQSAFQKAGIKRHIEVQKLVKAKYQDNLEFIQWFKRYFDLNCGSKGQGYDAVQKRNKIVPDFGFAQKTIVPKVYSGSGQVQAKTKEVKQKQSKPTAPLHQKKEQPPKHQKPVQQKIQKAEKKVTPKVPVRPSTTSNPTRVKTDVNEKKEEPKKVNVKKQQPAKQANIPTPAKKQDLTKKKPLSVHQTQPVKKNLQSTGVKNNTSTVHHAIQQSATKIKQLPKNEQKIKQLQGKIDKIKSIVSSGKQHQMMVNEIRKILAIETKKEQVKQQIGKDIKEQSLKQVKEQNANKEQDLLLDQKIEEKKLQTQQTNAKNEQVKHPEQLKQVQNKQKEESKVQTAENNNEEHQVVQQQLHQINQEPPQENHEQPQQENTEPLNQNEHQQNQGTKQQTQQEQNIKENSQQVVNNESDLLQEQSGEQNVIEGQNHGEEQSSNDVF